jgi:hypothetical protein
MLQQRQKVLAKAPSTRDPKRNVLDHHCARAETTPNSIVRQMLLEPCHHVSVKLIAAEIVHRLVTDAVVEDM